MSDFDPAAEFLLDMQWPNLFEPSNALPTNVLWRCKGCRAIVVQGDREDHYRLHVRQREHEREKHAAKIKRDRVERLAKARERRDATVA